MVKALAPAARSQFAKRLRAIRVRRGFERARHFAETLGVEENRYTRYERAEVEPSLTLLHKICQTLGVTPDQLLGFAEFGAEESSAALGFSETSSPHPSSTTKQSETTRDSLAWRLASEVINIYRQAHAQAKPFDPLKKMRDVGTLYQQLRAEPFGTIAEILAAPDLEKIDAGRRGALAELMDAYIQSVS